MAVSGYADLEATLWFEHLCCGLLSPQAERDFTQLNPFLSADAAAGKTFCGVPFTVNGSFFAGLRQRARYQLDLAMPVPEM